MREILFRGKSEKFENWIEGSLIVGRDLESGQLEYLIAPLSAYYTEVKKVVPETVGQYTGLTDKNGAKIFEGDIVMFGFSPCVVKYDFENGRYMFYDRCIYLKNGFNVDTMKTKEVVGNITDNPELLGGE